MVAEVKRKQEKKEKKRKKREKRRLEALAAAAEEMENSVQEAEVRAEAPSALWGGLVVASLCTGLFSSVCCSCPTALQGWGMFGPQHSLGGGGVIES